MLLNRLPSLLHKFYDSPVNQTPGLPGVFLWVACGLNGGCASLTHPTMRMVLFVGRVSEAAPAVRGFSISFRKSVGMREYIPGR